VNNHARYYRDCLRAALGTLPGEPLGANEKYLLDRPDAIEIANSAWKELERAGVKTEPRFEETPAKLARIRRGGSRRSALRGVPRLGAHPYKSAIGRQNDHFGTPRVLETTGVAGGPDTVSRAVSQVCGQQS
jgi:hypothetical protein